jgi:WD40 repeat protein
VLRGHTSPVDFASFSPDGSRLLTASEDGEIRVWPADGKSEPLVLRPHENGLNSAMFTPDGTSIITSGSGEIRIQRVTWSALIDYLRENTHACLTPEQRMKYLAETLSEAWESYEECERRRGREPTLKRPD